MACARLIRRWLQRHCVHLIIIFSSIIIVVEGLRYIAKVRNLTNEQIANTTDYGDFSVYNINSSPDINASCMVLKYSKPPTWICISNISDTVGIAGNEGDGVVLEPDIIKRVRQDVSLYSKDVGFIDIGAAIGVYSLIAATKGHSVIAMEADDRMLQLFAKAIKIGNLQPKIIVLKDGIEAVRHTERLQSLSLCNESHTYIQPNDTQNCSSSASRKHIDMNKFLPLLTFHETMIRIDVNGEECFVLQNALKFFDKVFVIVIIMAWRQTRNLYSTEDHLTIQHCIEFLSQRNYMVTNVKGQLLGSIDWNKWPDNIVWKYKTPLHEWVVNQ